jgi:hypothetical protein
VIGNAVKVMRIATGEERARKAGRKGSAARAVKLTKMQRGEIARVAAEAPGKKS